MKDNFNKETNLYRFIILNGLEDITEIKESDLSDNKFLNREQVSNLKYIKENLYELNGDFYVPMNYD